MHASSNFIVLLNGKKKDRKIACEYLQQYADDELEDDVKIIFEETYEIVWLDDIIDAFTKIAEKTPNLNFAVSGYVDCSESSGEFMDFGIVHQDGVMTVYSSDWSGYDDLEFDEDGNVSEEYCGREERFVEMCDMEVEDIDAAFDEMCQEIKEKEWDDVDGIELRE